MRRKLISFILLLLLAGLPLLKPRADVLAATIAPGEIIAMVNSMRTSNGLPALIEDAILNSTTAATAQQMASNGVCAHIGGARERIAAAGFGGGATVFATENIACAPDGTIDWLINVWGDAEHMMPMVESRYTHIGAGVYTDSNGLTYYVLHAAYSAGTGVFNPTSAPSNSTDEPLDTAQLVEPVFTVTPQEDGSIVHIVKYGQALFTIATWYNTSMEEIKALNNLTSNSIFVGQKLIIRLPPTPTITPTRTSTPRQPTRTPSMTPSPTVNQPVRTITPTPKPDLADSLLKIDRPWLGMGLLIISAIGLFSVTLFGFLRPMRKK